VDCISSVFIDGTSIGPQDARAGVPDDLCHEHGRYPSLSGWRALAGHSAAVVRAAAAPLAFPEQVRSADESHISGCIWCSGKIRSASSASLRAQLCDNVRRPPENIPTSPCAPIYPPQIRLLSRVTSYVSRRPLLRLHLAWLDTTSGNPLRKIE
jgi:hypothetical protein